MGSFDADSSLKRMEPEKVIAQRRDELKAEEEFEDSDEDGDHCDALGEYEQKWGDSQESRLHHHQIFSGSIQLSDLRNLIANPFVDFSPDVFYRLLEEEFKVNIYVLSQSAGSVFEIPRHRLYHTRPARKHRKCVLLYYSGRNDRESFDLVVATSANASQEERRGLFPKEMSTRCHAIITNSSRNTYIKNGIVYDSVLDDVDYLKYFGKNARAVMPVRRAT